MKYNCHCGNIHVTLHTDKKPQNFSPRRCSCSLCQKHSASYISDPDGKAEVKIQEKENINFYRFGHKTSDFIICKKCGILMLATCEINGIKRGVLNITPALDIDFGEEMATNFDSETVEFRLGRRSKTWTGNIEIIYD